MIKNNRSSKDPEDLRARAEESLKSEHDRSDDMCLEEANSLIHELRVHQIELEMQNEELRRVQNDLEISLLRYADLYDFAPVGYLTLNKHGEIVDLNLTAARLLGIERGLLINSHFQYFVFQPDKKEFLSHLDAIFDKRKRQIAEVRLSPKGGEQFCARLESIYLEGEEGAGLCMTNMSDVTLHKKSEQVLENVHDELARANERLTLEIEERRRAEEALKLFAYSVAHDLKSSAVGIYGLTKRLHKLSRDVLDEKSRSYCDQILKVSEHIAAFVEKINVYIATKEANLSFEKTNIKEILGMLKSEFSVQLNIRQIDWIVPDSEVEITADRLSLLRVFSNLVDNALKYGGAQLSSIRIGHEDRGDCHIFSVIDDGKGLKEADAEKIFGLFQRNETSRGVEGAGLGLAIVKEIAEQHGGGVWVEPRGKKGITFYVSISKNL